MPKLKPLFYCLLISTCIAHGSFSQTNQADSVLVIGQVLEEENYTGLPFAHVAVGSRATTTDFKGLFKARVSAADTIAVSYVGYKTQRITVPKDNTGPVFETKLILQRDTVMLDNANITILPSSIEAFKQAILSLDLSSQEYKNVERNMAALTQQVLIYDYNKYTMDAAENQRAAMSGPQSFNFLNVFRKVKEALSGPPAAESNPTPTPVYSDTSPLQAPAQPDSLLRQKADTTQLIINN